MKKVEGLDCILFIDDDKITNYIHKKVVESKELDVHVQIEDSGASALEYLKGSLSKSDSYVKPDLIFLDINMPGMSGWDFLEEYKQLSPEQKSKAVVVMLSASLNPDDRNKAEHINVVKKFINKTLTVSKLEEIIERYFS